MLASGQRPNPDLLIAEDIARFEFDPLGYVRYVFDWGHGALEREAGPDIWQQETLNEIGAAMRESDAAVKVAVASGHGIGKTALTSWVIHWFMGTRPGCAGVVTANTKDQLVNKTWRELAKWNAHAINGHWFDWSATAFRGKERPETWFIGAQPWTKERSEAFAGLHERDVLVLFDEASAIDDIIWEVAEGAMTERGALWLALGNPTRNTGRFRECFGRFRHRWTTRKIDSRTAARANKAQIQQWIEDYGEDSDFVRVRVRGEFPRASSTQFIASDMIAEAQARDDVFSHDEPMLIGVDVARYGDDETVIAYRKGRNAREVQWETYRGKDTMFVANRVAAAARNVSASAIFVDGGGLGAGVVDRLKQLDVGQACIYDVQFGASPDAGWKLDQDVKVANKRAEMWAAMRDWMKTGMLPADGTLADQLAGVEYGINARDEILLERKESMKARGLESPDRADALALTFAYPVKPQAFVATGGAAFAIARANDRQKDKFR